MTGADNGEGALAAFETDPPDVVLLDVMMPGVSGYDVCRRLKEDPRTRLIPVLLLTGLESTADRVKGMEAGADEFVSKPCDGVELVARVRNLLRTKWYTDELEEAETVLFALAKAVERRDSSTEDHCERIAHFAVDLGRVVGLPQPHLKALRRAGFLHDIGKVGIPDAVLLKPGPLSDTEREVMRQHPLIGERICRGLRSLRDVLPIIRHHHERLDGTGYPDGLRGHQIPLTARVLQIVDVFDALTAERPYKDPLSVDAALNRLAYEVREGWWDADVFHAFVPMLRERINRGDTLIN